MTLDQMLVLGLIACGLILFVWGKYRHDLVALILLLTAVGLGLVPAQEAFTGLGHPAVITVAAVLVLSRALTLTGAVDALAARTLPKRASTPLLILSSCLLAATLSAFMNNVGALALLMPVAIQAAHRNSISPSLLLMPLSFASILGGMTTLIGTPPNLIVSGFRRAASDETFGMFDFTRSASWLRWRASPSSPLSVGAWSPAREKDHERKGAFSMSGPFSAKYD